MLFIPQKSAYYNYYKSRTNKTCFYPFIVILTAVEYLKYHVTDINSHPANSAVLKTFLL